VVAVSFYSPGIGRWTTRDPIEEGGGTGLYDAFANCPIGAFDAQGLYECRSEGFAAHDPWYGIWPIFPPAVSGSGVSAGCNAWLSHWGSAIRPYPKAICNSGVPDTHITIAARSPCCRRYRVTCTVVYSGETGQEKPAGLPPNRGTQAHLIVNNLGLIGDWKSVATAGADSIWRAKLVKTMSVTQEVQIGPSWATLVRVMPVITAGTREGSDTGRWRGGYLSEYSSARCSLSEIGPCN
jgi:hypothetical protein